MDFFLTEKYIIVQCVLFSVLIAVLTVNRLDKTEGFFSRIMGVAVVSPVLYLLFILIIKFMIYLHGY